VHGVACSASGRARLDCEPDLAHHLGGAEPYSAAWFGQKALGVLFALAVDIVLILIIIVEVRRSTPKAIRVEKIAGGEVMISTASIADRLEYETDQLAGVLRVKAKVSAKRRGVLIELDVQTAAEINVPEQADRIVETARAVVEDKMGLKLARPPKVNLRAVPYPAAPVVPVRPKEMPSIPPDRAMPSDVPDEETPAPPQAEAPASISDASPDDGSSD